MSDTKQNSAKENDHNAYECVRIIERFPLSIETIHAFGK